MSNSYLRKSDTLRLWFTHKGGCYHSKSVTGLVSFVKVVPTHLSACILLDIFPEQEHTSPYINSSTSTIPCLCPISGQSYKHFTIIVYASRMILTLYLPRVRLLSIKFKSKSINKIHLICGLSCKYSSTVN